MAETRRHILRMRRVMCATIIGAYAKDRNRVFGLDDVGFA